MFNENQQKAIRHLDGPAIVLAGPGSGKTTVIVERLKNLIRLQIPPEKILVVTFTKKHGPLCWLILGLFIVSFIGY